MGLFLVYLVLASVPNIVNSQGVSVSIKSNTPSLFCQDETELIWTQVSTKSSIPACSKSGKPGEVWCTCADCQSLAELKNKQFLKTPLPDRHDGLTRRVMDCISRFNGPLETGQIRLSEMSTDKWYQVDTLEIGQKTTEEELKLAVRIVGISGGLIISNSNLNNLTLLAQILQSRNLKISGKLTVVDNPELDNIDDLLLRGYDTIEIRNNAKLKIGWETLEVIKKNYVTYSQYQDNVDLASDFDRFNYDFLNHKCPAPDVSNGGLLGMNSDCYVLEGDLQLSELKENDQQYGLERLGKVLYVRGSVTFSNDQTNNDRLSKLINLMSIDNGQKQQPALRVQNVSIVILDLPNDLFDLKCGQEPCVQLDKKFYDNDDEESRKILLHAVKEKKTSLGLTQKGTTGQGSGQEKSSKNKSIVIGVSVWTAIFLLASATVLFLSNCVFEWPKPKTERRKDGMMPIQKLFLRKKKEKTITKSEKMEKTDPETGQKTVELPKKISGKTSLKKEPTKKKSGSVKSKEPISKPSKPTNSLLDEVKKK